MKKIEFYHSIFTADETNSMATQSVLLLNESGSTDKFLLLAKEAIEKKNLVLTNVLHTLQSNPYTKELGLSDDWRDDTHVGGRDAVRAMTHWVFAPAIKEAAERLEEIFIRHGWGLQNYGYQKQSSATNSLITELKQKQMQEDIATCGLTKWFEAEVKGQENFEKLFNVKLGHKSKTESIKKREAQIPVNEKIDQLITYLNSTISFNKEDEVWNDIYNRVESIIKQATTVSRSRRSGRNEKPEDK